jgi:GxxExxY protein
VIGCAIEVHRVLGPGLLESVYEHCLARELDLHGLRSVWQTPLPIAYKGVHLACGYRIDCVVEDELLVELKTVERVLPIHHAQILTYLKLLKVRQALLINFNSRRLIDGLKSFLA